VCGLSGGGARPFAVFAERSQRDWRRFPARGWPFTAGALPLPFDAFALPPAFGVSSVRGLLGGAVARAASAGTAAVPSFTARLSARHRGGRALSQYALAADCKVAGLAMRPPRWFCRTGD
jgi:hypothetical protein